MIRGRQPCGCYGCTGLKLTEERPKFLTYITRNNGAKIYGTCIATWRRPSINFELMDKLNERVLNLWAFTVVGADFSGVISQCQKVFPLLVYYQSYSLLGSIEHISNIEEWGCAFVLSSPICTMLSVGLECQLSYTLEEKIWRETSPHCVYWTMCIGVHVLLVARQQGIYWADWWSASFLTQNMTCSCSALCLSRFYDCAM